MPPASLAQPADPSPQGAPSEREPRVLTSSAREPRVLASSLRDRASAAMGAGELEEAIPLLERWLEADPRDHGSWYNLSCLLALTDRRERAIEALETAVDAGFANADHAVADEDLASLRDDPRFGAAIERSRQAARGEGPEDHRRHFIETTTLGTYLVMLPPDHESIDGPLPVCVILHGRGSSELRHGRIADRVGREGVIYIAPRALHAQHTGGPDLGWSGWPTDRLEEGDMRPLSGYVDLVLRCLDDAATRYPIDLERVHLWGHSQGAAMAAVCASRYPDRFASAFCYAGFFPEPWGPPEVLEAMARRGVRITLVHGEDDRVVLPEESRNFEARLTAAGVESSVRWVAGGHGISPEVAEESRLWLEETVRGSVAR